MIDVLVVDDSALMRKHLRTILESDGGFTVRFARNGAEALQAIADQKPDVVTLDINMPVMDGLTCLSRIMAESPLPVIMVSSLTEEGALATFEALELGALDYIAKPGGTVSLNISDIGAELITKVRAVTGARHRPRASAPPARPRKQKRRPVRAETAAGGVVVIGVSTGGPRALEEVLPGLPEWLPWPVLVIQHMPASFTQVFAERLDRICPLGVTEVTAPEPLHAGRIYLARGDADMVVSRRARGLMVMPVPSDPKAVWHPSVDRLAESVAQYFEPASVIGVLLTGMGSDGAEPLAELHRRGGRTVAESEETAVVFGMPGELVRREGADAVLPVEAVSAQIREWLDEGGQVSCR